MSGVDVVLGPVAMLLATAVASMRQAQNLTAGRRDAYGAPTDPAEGYKIHLLGAAGEVAVAEYLGVYYDGALGRMRATDAGWVQVRTTMYPRGCLILHDTDPDDDVFVLVTGNPPQLRLEGRIRGRDGKRPEFWRDPSKKGRPAFFVPQDALGRMRDRQAARGGSPQIERAPAGDTAEAPDSQRSIAQ
jgi:hypothetical protein